MHRFSSTIASILLITLFLAGCSISGPIMTVTPEQAAIRAAVERPGNHAVVNQGSVQVRQSVQFDRYTFVVLSFNQIEDNRKDTCTFVTQTFRNALGRWQPSSSGGGCSGMPIGQPEPPKMPVEAGGGQSGSAGQGEPDYSHTAGLVNRNDIAKVRVTWNDGSQQEADVVNGSYIVVRTGRFNNQKIEGLNADGEVVYSNDPLVAPGKE